MENQSATHAGVQHCASAGVHALNHQVVKHHLALGSLKNVLLNTAAGHKPVVWCDVIRFQSVMVTHS